MDQNWAENKIWTYFLSLIAENDENMNSSLWFQEEALFANCVLCLSIARVVKLKDQLGPQIKYLARIFLGTQKLTVCKGGHQRSRASQFPRMLLAHPKLHRPFIQYLNLEHCSPTLELQNVPMDLQTILEVNQPSQQLAS